MVFLQFQDPLESIQFSQSDKQVLAETGEAGDSDSGGGYFDAIRIYQYAVYLVCGIAMVGFFYVYIKMLRQESGFYVKLITLLFALANLGYVVEVTCYSRI